MSCLAAHGAEVCFEKLFYEYLVSSGKVKEGGAEVFFENLDLAEGWRLAEQSEPITDNGYTIRFCRYVNDGVKEL